MARPKKTETETPNVELKVEAGDAKGLPKLESSAFSLHKNGDMYEVVEIAFDYDTGDAHVVKRVPTNRHKYRAIEGLKLVLGKYLMLKFGKE